MIVDVIIAIIDWGLLYLWSLCFHSLMALVL